MGHIHTVFKRAKDAVFLRQEKGRVVRRKKKRGKAAGKKKQGIRSKLREFKRRIREKLKMQEKR